MHQLRPIMIDISARYLGIQGPVGLGNGAPSQAQTQRGFGESVKVENADGADGAEAQNRLGKILSLVPFVLQLSTPCWDTVAVYYRLDTDSSGICHVDIIYAKSTPLTWTNHQMTQELSNLFQTIPQATLSSFSASVFRHIAKYSSSKLRTILNELGNLSFQIIAHLQNTTVESHLQISRTNHLSVLNSVFADPLQLVSATTLLEKLAAETRSCRDHYKDMKGETSNRLFPSSFESLCGYARSLNEHEVFRRAMTNVRGPEAQKSVSRFLWLLSALGTYAYSAEKFWQFFSHPTNVALLPSLRLIPAKEPNDGELINFWVALGKYSNITRYDYDTVSNARGEGVTSDPSALNGSEDCVEVMQKAAGQSLDIKWTSILRAETTLALHLRSTAADKVLGILPMLNCIMYPDQGQDNDSDANWNTVFPPLSQPGCSLDEDRYPINTWIDSRLLPVEHRLRSELWIYVETAKRVAKS
jgi:hypothetical protein